MKKTVNLWLVIFMLLIGNNICGQYGRYNFEIKAKSVEDEIYPIEILVPDDYDPSFAYPIVYCTDWWYFLEYESESVDHLKANLLAKQIIIVGIGTIGNRTDWSLERLRDFTPTHLPEFDRQDSLKIGTRGITGGANNFLRFLKHELIPLVETKYLSDTLNRGYVGYSGGGRFGAYILYKDPYLFKHYLLGSPHLSYDNYIVIEEIKGVAPDKLSSVKTIFLSVGEEEWGDQLKGFADLRDIIKAKKLPDLNFESCIFEGEGHLTAFSKTIAFGMEHICFKE